MVREIQHISWKNKINYISVESKKDIFIKLKKSKLNIFFFAYNKDIQYLIL